MMPKGHRHKMGLWKRQAMPTGPPVTIASTTNANLREVPGTEFQALDIIQNGHILRQLATTKQATEFRDKPLVKSDG